MLIPDNGAFHGDLVKTLCFRVRAGTDRLQAFDQFSTVYNYAVETVLDLKKGHNNISTVNRHFCS